MPTGPEYLKSARELEKVAEGEQSIGEAQLGLARAQLHATYALIETVADSDRNADGHDDSDVDLPAVDDEASRV